MNRTILVVLLAAALQVVRSAKILAFICQTARSHHIVLQPILKELALKGHEVDYYTHFPISQPPKNLNQIELGRPYEGMQNLEELNLREIGKMSVVENIIFHKKLKFDDTESCVNVPAVHDLLSSNKKYDIVIGEFFFLQEDFLVLLHKFKALGVAFSSLPDNEWLNEMAGLPDNPAYQVGFFSDFTDEMNFFQRLTNTVTSIVTKAIHYYYIGVEYQAHADKHWAYEGLDHPSLIEAAKRIALFLVNSHHSVGFAFPRAPHVKEIMGTHINQDLKPLPKDIQEYIDGAEHGIIYFSLGSMVSVSELRAVLGYEPLVNVLKKTKQKVIWKWTSWTGEPMPDIPNVKIVEWVPQQTLLAHNKTKCFITHGGLGGISEGIHYGVPMIGLPVFADQFRNVELMDKGGFGIKLNFNNLTESSISSALNKVLFDPKYKQAVEIRSKLFNDRILPPVQYAAYWIEYIAKHGNVLQPASARMPFYQLYLLDVLAVLFLSALIAFMTTKFLIKKLCSLCTKNTPKILENKKRVKTDKKVK